MREAALDEDRHAQEKNWSLTPAITDAWTAVMRSGTTVHVLASHDLREMRAKLEMATHDREPTTRG